MRLEGDGHVERGLLQQAAASAELARIDRLACS
jgi:hypothetical protein